MIRFVDMRLAQIAGVRFGFWDTVCDRMIELDGDQGWEDIDGLRDSFEGEKPLRSRRDPLNPALLERLIGLCPEWLRESPAHDVQGAEVPVCGERVDGER